MGVHKYKAYIKGERVRKQFLKDQVTGRKAQTQRENSIFIALCDALAIKPDLSETELLSIAEHVDRIVNSEWMRYEAKEKHKQKYTHLFYRPPELFRQINIDPCAYRVDSKNIINHSRPFTKGAYKYIIKQILQELEKG